MTRKATITERRLLLRSFTWETVKSLLQHHLATADYGEQSRMARAIGLEPSQLHRYSCPVCEHDQEPSFSVGIAILAYLQLELKTTTDDTTLPKGARKTKKTNRNPQFRGAYAFFRQAARTAKIRKIQ